MTNTGNEMATPSSQLAKSRVTDSSKDYTDLLAEMGIQPNAQEQVFTIIKRFRDKPNNLIRIRAGTDGGRRYINTILFGKNMMKEFAVVAKGISSPFRDLFDGDKRVAALPIVTKIINQLWLRMHDLIFYDATAPLPEKRTQEDKQPELSSRKRTSSTLSSISGTVDVTEQRPLRGKRAAFSRNFDFTEQGPQPGRPPAFSTGCSESESYHAQTIRLLDAVLGPPLPPNRAAPAATDPGTRSNPRTLTGAAQKGARVNIHAQPANAEPPQKLVSPLERHDGVLNTLSATTITPRRSARAQVETHARATQTESLNARHANPKPVSTDPSTTEPANIPPTNPNLIAANDRGGIDRAWQIVEDMIRQRRGDNNRGDGNRGEWLLFYSGK